MSSSLFRSLTAGKKKSSSGPSWLKKHWDTTVVLMGIFIIALMIRAYFAYETATEFGLPYLLGGGADSHYNARIINYIAEYKEHLVTDPLRGYPLEGLSNTRPPLYSWSVVLGGYLLAPFVGNLDKAINHSFILSSAFWGALTVFPTYLIGKKTFGKKAGIAGAFLMAISAAHLERGVLTNTNHDAFSMFLIMTVFFFFMRSLEEMKAGNKWVSDWAKVDEIKKGLSQYFGSNKKSMLYAAMTGVTMGALTLTWKGYSYVMVIILVYFLIQLIIDKFREKDSMGITINIFIIFIIAFLLAMPWYAQGSPEVLTDWWPLTTLNRYFQTPVFIFLGTFGLGVYFTVTRDLPWILTFSILIVAGVLFFTLGPDVIQSAASQYFIESKLYSTIAEAQAPMFSRLVLAGGVATFFLSWLGIALSVWHLRRDWSRSFVFILVWTAFAIYMATTATRFIFNASPALALTAGWVLALLFDKTGFDEIGRYFRRHRGNLIGKIREGVKIKHVLVTLLVVFLLLTPNVLYAIDAGIPYEEKQGYEEQIYDTLPSYLRPPDYDPEEDRSHYLGAFGYSLDKPTDYWYTAWEDLKEEDKEIPPEERPAFLSWWDYGFEAMNLGEHPTVADNFQTAYRFAGNFLMAQNESEMMALLVGRQLQLPYREEGGFKEDGKVREILEAHIGVEKTEKLEDIYENPASYRQKVLSNPERYHPRADDIDNRNVRWAMIMGTLSYEDIDTLSSLYRSISFDSGYERLENRIGYFAVDSRLFPTSARDTGIFHAPAYLSGHRVDESGRGRVPFDFYKILLVDQQGRTYEDQEEIPEDAQIIDRRIEFQDMFYNSALYRIFAGYSLQEVGEEQGIPGIDNQQRQPTRPGSQPKRPKPGWNLTHFNEFHRTAYFNPYPRDEVQNHTDAWRAMPYKEAIEYRGDENVTVDLSPRSYMNQGVIFLRYYDGAILEGRVTTKDGEPISNAKVTVLDMNTSGRFPTPQHTSRTDEEGRYRAILPEGNITVMVSTGGEGEKQIKQEQIPLDSEQFEITKEQALRRKIDRNGDGKPDYRLENDFEVDSGQVSGKVFLDRDDEGSYDPQNDTMVSSVGEVRMKNEYSSLEYTIDIQEGNYAHKKVVPGKYTIETTISGSETLEGIEVKPGQEATNDIPVSTGNLTGAISHDMEDLEAKTVTLSLRGTNRTIEVTFGETNNFKFENLPSGEYTLEIVDEAFTLRQGPQDIEIGQGESKQRPVTVVRAHRVEGLIRQGEDRLSNQRLNILTRNYDREIKTDENGEFSIKLPEGHYNIYGVNHQGSQVTAFLDDILVDGDKKSYEGEFLKAQKLSGTAEYDGEGVKGAEIFVKDGSGAEYYMTTNQEGRYKTYLPELSEGQYTVYGWYTFRPGGDIEHSLYFWDEVDLNRDKEITLEGSRGHILQGKVVRDTLPERGIFTRIKVKCEDRTTPLQATTTIDGEYRVLLPEGECTFTIKKEGYKKWTETIDPSKDTLGEKGQISLRAKDVTVEGSVDLSDHPIDEMDVTFKPTGEGAVWKNMTVTENESDYMVELQPGIYEIDGDLIVAEGNAKYDISDSLTLRPRDNNKWKDLEIVYKLRLAGDVVPNEDEKPSADIDFQGSEEKLISVNGTYETYLQPGDYSIRAIHSKGISATQMKLTLNEAKDNVNFNLGSTTRVNHLVSGPIGEQMEITFRNTESEYVIKTTTDIDGVLDLNISHGEYEITVNHKTEEEIEGEIREVLYHLNLTTDIPTQNLNQKLDLEKKILNSTLSGVVTVDGERVSDLKLEIPGTDYDEIKTDEGGKFEVEELLHGEYTLYTEYETSFTESYSFFDTFEMPTKNHTINIALEDANVFSGKVTLEGKGVQTELTLRKGNAKNTFQTEEDGSFRILLPKDTYSVEIEISKEVDHRTNRYTYETEVDMDEDRQGRNFTLGMVEEYDMEISGLESETASQGDVVHYTAQIKNMGNMPDKYEFSADVDGWEITFGPKTTSEISPGGTQEIDIEVKVAEDATVGESIGFTVDSLNSEKSLEKDIPIEIRQIHGVEILREIKDKKYRPGELTYTVEIRNTGNGPDVYNVEASTTTPGWKVNVTKQPEEIGTNETGAIEVQFRSISSDPKEQIELELMVHSESDDMAHDSRTFTTSLPEITAYRDTVEFEGDEFIMEEKPFTLSNWQWAGIIIIVGIGAVYVMKKKRWI